MSKRSKLSETRDGLRLADIAVLLLECEANELEQKIVKTWVDILDNGKDGDKLDVIDQYMSYKYGRPKQQTDITTAGESLNRGVDLNKLNNDEILRLAELTNKAAD